MSRNIDPLEETDSRLSRRRVALIVIAVLCLVVAAAALFAVLRSDGGVESEEEITEVTFGPEDAATSLPAPLPGSRGIIGLGSASAPAGSKVRVQGVSFKAGQDFGPVELYWDKAEGQPLATAEGPRFAIDVTIPADAPVLVEGHNIIAVQRSKDGEVVNLTSLRFFVVPPR